MAKLARPVKKRPSDYPQMAFRVSAEDKAALEKLISEIHVTANENIKDEHRVVKKTKVQNKIPEFSVSAVTPW